MQRDALSPIRGRMNAVFYVVAGAMLILVGGFWHFQMAQSARYLELADNNRFKQIPLIARRGQILDREGRILVDNRPSYDIVYVREGAKHPVPETLSLLGSGIGMTVDELLERIQRSKDLSKFLPIVLKADVDVSDIAFVKAHRLELLPEIDVEYQPRRRYLFGDLASHAIGYMGEVNNNDLKADEFKNYRTGDEIGKAGLERVYDSILRGQNGYRRVVVDSGGRQVDVLGEELPIPGNTIRTTLDLDLQKAAEEALGDLTGAVVAIKPATGEVLVLASKPSFDPNLFATQLLASDFRALEADPRLPFLNRVIQDNYAPGSVFKIFMAAAALEAETLNQYDHVNCTGVLSVDGVTKHCWKAGGHGPVGLYEAIVNSCNVFFYEVGRKLGIDKIAYYAMEMGLGSKTGIDLPGERPGLIPSREWKASAFKTRGKSEQVWYPAETLDVAIGQGAVSVTPLQAAWAMGGLASGGRLVQPHLVDPQGLTEMGFAGRPVDHSDYPIRAETVDIVARGMWGVVNEAGTGTRAAVQGFDVAGKTGTAQVVSRKSYGKEEDFEDNAWFVGFAPYRNPEIVVAAFVEHGGHGGSAAAPVAHAIFDTYYRKKTGQFGSETDGKLARIQP